MAEQLSIVDVGARIAGVERGMAVREKMTGRLGVVIEVAGKDAFTLCCHFSGDVAVELGNGQGCSRLRVCGPERYFWTQFDLVGDRR
jgi:hypothetical protein